MMQQIKPRQRVHTHTYVQRSSQVDKRALCCRPAAAAFVTKSQIVEWSSFSCGSISIEPMFQVQTLRLVTGRLLPRSLPLAATDCCCHIRLPRRHLPPCSQFQATVYALWRIFTHAACDACVAMPLLRLDHSSVILS